MLVWRALWRTSTSGVSAVTVTVSVDAGERQREVDLLDLAETRRALRTLPWTRSPGGSPSTRSCREQETGSGRRRRRRSPSNSCDRCYQLQQWRPEGRHPRHPSRCLRSSRAVPAPKREQRSAAISNRIAKGLANITFPPWKEQHNQGRNTRWGVTPTEPTEFRPLKIL